MQRGARSVGLLAALAVAFVSAGTAVGLLQCRFGDSCSYEIGNVADGIGNDYLVFAGGMAVAAFLAAFAGWAAARRTLRTSLAAITAALLLWLALVLAGL